MPRSGFFVESLLLSLCQWLPNNVTEWAPFRVPQAYDSIFCGLATDSLGFYEQSTHFT
jgi:hypothetical protein